MTRSLWRRRLVMPGLAAALVILAAVQAPVVAGDAYQVTLEYTVNPGTYDNAVRAANLTAMLYPRIVVDRNETSPFAGTVYVLGLRPAANGTCANPVVVRSSDDGESFGPPAVSDLCLPGLTLDPVVTGNGTLLAATWGPRIIGSLDGGISWQPFATLGNASTPASLALDPVSGGLVVTWTDGGWTLPGNVSVSASQDGGRTWTAPVNPLPGGVLGISPQPAAFGSSVVLGLVESNGSEPSIAAVASHDAGTTWSAPQTLTAAAPCMRFAAPSAAVSPEGVFAVSWYADPANAGTDCWGGWGNRTETFVAISSDNGTTFSAPRLAGGPPGWPTVSFGDAVAFDDESRLYVTWHAVPPDWSNASIYVADASSARGNFSEASFETDLEVRGGNSTAQENLAPGRRSSVFLVWEAFDPTGGPDSPNAGVFVRRVAGEAHGDVDLRVTGTVSSIDMEFRDPLSGDVRDRVHWTGGAVVVPELPPSVYNVTVLADNRTFDAGHLPVVTWGRTVFTLRIVSPSPGPSGSAPIPWDWIFVGVGGVVAAGAALSILHHVRLSREAVFQRKVRLLAYEYIRDHPGASYSAVRDALGLKNGVASYHLAVLEKLGLVHSESRRRHRWYWPNGDVSLWRELPLSPIQASILEEVRRSPGIGVRELARATNHRASSVGYNVKAMATEGVLRTERVGRRLRCFSMDAGAA